MLIVTKGKKKILHMILTIIVAYILFCIVVCILQRGLIYFPTKLHSQVAESIAAKKGFVPWKNQSGAIIGWKLPATTRSTGTVLIVHGNAGCALDRGYFANPIHAAAAVDVYVFEYPGYGARDGSPGLKSSLSAADEAFVLLDRAKPIYIVSESIGTGVAAHLAGTYSNDVSGLVLFAPFTSFKSLAQRKMPFLPVSLILFDRFDPEAWLKNYSGPVKIIVAEKDEIIPAKLGRQLYEGYSGPKNLEVILDARHNDVAAQSAEWWKSVFSFWQMNAK